MQRWLIIGLVAALVSPIPEGAKASLTIQISDPINSQTSVHEIATVAIQKAVARLGAPGGFFRAPEYHIPLPTDWDKQVTVLQKVYSQRLCDAVEMAINRAAEKSVPSLDEQVSKALQGMSFADADRLLHGPDNAIDAQLQAQLGPTLRSALMPIVESNLKAVDGTTAYDRMRARYEYVTGVAFPNFDLVAYTTDQLLQGFFTAVADQETLIRHEPSARSTTLLKEIFASP